MVMALLRHIAVHVEEPETGEFAWVLMERKGGRWQEMGRSKSPEATYKAAMAAGLVALQAMVEDLDVGPRPDEASRVRAKGVHRRARETLDAPAKEAAPAKLYFGFGPAR